jgi:membrane protease YdiL (CAAX protease family)
MEAAVAMTNKAEMQDKAGRSAPSSRLPALVRAIALGVAFTATLTALAVPIGVAYLAYQRWIGGHSLQEASLHLEDALLLLQAVTAVLAMAGAFVWVRFFQSRIDRQGDLRGLGWTRIPRGWASLGLGALGGALLAGVPVGLALAAGELTFGTSHWALEGGTDVIADALGSLVVIASLVVGEELVFRGYMPWTMRRGGWSEGLTTLLPALLFALYRSVLAPASLAVFLNALAAGALLGLLARLTGSLHVSIGARLGWALVVGVVLSLPVGGAPVEGILHSLPTPGLALDKAFGPEGSWLLLMLLLVGVALAQMITSTRRTR